MIAIDTPFWKNRKFRKIVKIVIAIMFILGILVSIYFIADRTNLTQIEDAINSGQFQKAEELINDTKVTDANLDDLLILTAKLKLITGDLVKAEEIYTELLEYDELKPLAYTGLGTVYRKLDDYELANSFFERAIELDPENAGAYLGKALVEMQQKNNSEAVDLALKSYRLDPENATIAANLSLAYHYNLQVGERDKYFEIAKDLNYPKIENLKELFKIDSLLPEIVSYPIDNSYIINL